MRDVNVELVKALKLAEKESKDSQKALVAAESATAKAKPLPFCFTGFYEHSIFSGPCEVHFLDSIYTTQLIEHSKKILFEI